MAILHIRGRGITANHVEAIVMTYVHGRPIRYDTEQRPNKVILTIGQEHLPTLIQIFETGGTQAFIPNGKKRN